LPKREKTESELKEEQRIAEIQEIELIEGFKSTSRIFMMVVAVLVIGFVLMSVTEVTPARVAETIQTMFANIGGTGAFPVDVSGKNILETKAQGRNTVVLTDTGLLSYNGAGKEIFNRQHSFSSPALEVSGNRALIFDRGGKEVRVETSGKTLFKRDDFDNNILNAAIGENGNYAVVTESVGYEAAMYVYDRDNAQSPFTWFSYDNYVVALGLSPDGKKAAVAGIHAEEGDLISTVFVFDFQKKNPIAQFDYPDTVFASVRFKDNYTICAVGDNLCSMIDIHETANNHRDYSYGDALLYSFDNTSTNGTALYISGYQDFKPGRIILLANNGDQKAEINIPEKASRVALNDKGEIIALTNSVVTRYGADGELRGTRQLDTAPVNILAPKQNLISIGTDTIQKLTEL